MLWEMYLGRGLRRIEPRASKRLRKIAPSHQINAGGATIYQFESIHKTAKAAVGLDFEDASIIIERKIFPDKPIVVYFEQDKQAFDCAVLAFRKRRGLLKQVCKIIYSKSALANKSAEEVRKQFTSGALPSEQTDDGVSNYEGAVAIPVMVKDRHGEHIWGFFIYSVSGGNSDEENQRAALEALLPEVEAFVKKYGRGRLTLMWAFDEA